MPSAAKVMVEVYREAGYDRRFRVVYFTELDEHNRDAEINRALAGEHFWDGFLAELHLPAAKQVISRLVQELNNETALTPGDFDAALREFSA